MWGTAHRRAVSAILGMVCALPGRAVLSAEPATVKLSDSTPVKLLLLDRMNSSTNQVDDIIHFEVAEDVKARGMVVITKGALAGGHIVDVHRRGRRAKAGALDFALDYVKAVDGSSIRVHAGSPSQAKTKSSHAPDPLHLMERGREVEIPQGARFVAYVDGDHEISPEPALAAATPGGANAPRPTGSGMNDLSVVTFTSTPDHADITVDGKFLGTTPSSIRLETGDHSVTIEKSGFKAWQRIMTAYPGGDVSLDVSLEKLP